jgi:hypothetical protein
MDAAPDKIGVGEVKNIIGNHSGSATNSHIYRGPEYAAANGNISMNLHTVIFTPAAMALEVHFTPATGPLADPLYRTINVDFN